MDTKFIHTLISVVRTGSFAGAARSENLTPAAVSQRVRSLEAELGETLIVRSGQRVTATPACLSILGRMRHIVNEVDKIAGDLDATGLNGRLRLGAISTALGDRVPGILSRFAKQAPMTELSITPGTSEGLFAMLDNEEIDAALIAAPPFKIPKAIQVIEIERQPFILIAQAQDQRTDEQIINDDKVLVYDPKSWGGRLVTPWIAERVRPGQILCELDALEAIATAIGQGIGCAIVPDWPGLSSIETIRRITLKDMTCQRKIVLAHRRLHPAILRLLEA